MKSLLKQTWGRQLWRSLSANRAPFTALWPLGTVHLYGRGICRSILLRGGFSFRQVLVYDCPRISWIALVGKLWFPLRLTSKTIGVACCKLVANGECYSLPSHQIGLHFCNSDNRHKPFIGLLSEVAPWSSVDLLIGVTFGIGVVGTLSVKHRAAQWSIMVMIFFWFHSISPFSS